MNLPCASKREYDLQQVLDEALRTTSPATTTMLCDDDARVCLLSRTSSRSAAGERQPQKEQGVTGFLSSVVSIRKKSSNVCVTLRDKVLPAAAHRNDLQHSNEEADDEELQKRSSVVGRILSSVVFLQQQHRPLLMQNRHHRLTTTPNDDEDYHQPETRKEGSLSSLQHFLNKNTLLKLNPFEDDHGRDVFAFSSGSPPRPQRRKIPEDTHDESEGEDTAASSTPRVIGTPSPHHPYHSSEAELLLDLSSGPSEQEKNWGEQEIRNKGETSTAGGEEQSESLSSLSFLTSSAGEGRGGEGRNSKEEEEREGKTTTTTITRKTGKIGEEEHGTGDEKKQQKKKKSKKKSKKHHQYENNKNQHHDNKLKTSKKRRRSSKIKQDHQKEEVSSHETTTNTAHKEHHGRPLDEELSGLELPLHLEHKELRKKQKKALRSLRRLRFDDSMNSGCGLLGHLRAG